MSFNLQGYQFWCRADRKGNFVVNNIRAGDYNLYGWVPGIIGDYKYEGNVTITPGMKICFYLLKPNSVTRVRICNSMYRDICLE